MINIGLLGLGTVGTGVVEILNTRKDGFQKITGQEINIKKVLVRNTNKERQVKLDKEKLTDDFNQILNDEEISIVIEVTGDLDLSYKYITESLKSGKDVVTANKAVVSKYFEELSSLAQENNRAFLYEASVGGGIPVLKPLKEQLALNEISEVQGILNGTCNYILTRMINEAMGYDEVLKTAQELGYAEADTTADVEGYDTQRKLRILATLSLQGKVSEEDILLAGISSIQSVDIEHIKNMDASVKLIAEARAYEDGFTAVVEPTIVKNSNYFANVNMVFNSVAFKGDNIGELKFYGAGAGKLPTANAVLSDVLDIVLNTYRKGNPLGEKVLKNYNHKISGNYYLRISDVREDITHSLRSIANNVLSLGSQTAVLTNEIELSKLKEIISSFGIGKKDYFLARINF